MTRVALVHAYAGTYSLGTENYVRYLAKELAKLQQDVYLITGSRRKVKAIKDIEIICAHFMDITRRIEPRSKMLARFQVLKSVSGIVEGSSIMISNFVRLLKKFDVVNAQYIYEFMAAVHARRFTRTPVIFTAHGFSHSECKAVKLADAVISVSEPVRAAYKQATGIESYVIPGGVDITAFKPKTISPNPKPTILTIARLHPIKGIEYLLRSISIFKKYVPSVRCLVVGPGYQDYYRKMSKALKVSENISFVGEVEHETLPRYYAIADIVVVPSLYEGFGLVVLEAMACGKPVIATSVGNIPYLINDGVNGLLIPPKDEKAIAYSLYKIVTNNKLRRKLGGNARRTALKYSWTEIARKILNVYSETVS